MLDDLAKFINKIAGGVDDGGILVFFPSYYLMERCR